MSLIERILVVVGLCLGALGSAGFYAVDESGESPQPWAWPLFGGGVVSMIAGAAVRAARSRGGRVEEEHHARKNEVLTRVKGLSETVSTLDAEKAALDGDALRSRIDAILVGDYFELTEQNDEIILLLGFADYARIWEGVANAERLLARTWSMASDGHVEEAREELAHARVNLEHAAQAAAAVCG